MTTMSSLRARFASLDVTAAPDLRDEIKRRAEATSRAQSVSADGVVLRRQGFPEGRVRRDRPLPRFAYLVIGLLVASALVVGGLGAGIWKPSLGPTPLPMATLSPSPTVTVLSHECVQTRTPPDGPTVVVLDETGVINGCEIIEHPVVGSLEYGQVYVASAEPSQVGLTATWITGCAERVQVQFARSASGYTMTVERSDRQPCGGGSSLAAIRLDLNSAIAATDVAASARDRGRGPSDTGLSTTAPPTPNATPTPSRSPSATLVTIEAGPRIASVPMGQTFHAADFGEPFTFVVPNLGLAGSGTQEVTAWAGQTLARGFALPREVTVVFLDDAVLPDDLCSNSGSITDIPGTLDAVTEWLESPGVSFASAPGRLVVDGRNAMSFDVEIGEDCYTSASAPADDPAIWFRERHEVRVVAIPTRSDLIVMFAWIDVPEADCCVDNPRGTRNSVTDTILASIRFD